MTAAIEHEGEDSGADRREAARSAYRKSLADGSPLSGADLARRFGMSARWGRLRVEEVRNEATAAAPGGPAEPGLVEGQDHADAWLPTAVAGPTVVRFAGPRSTPDAEPPGIASSGSAVDPVTASPAIRRATTVAVVAVASVAAVVSFEHQRMVAELAGEGWRSWLLPISVDGLVLVGSMSALARRRSGQRADRLTSVAMTLGLVASLAVNVIANDPGLLDPTWVRRLVGAWSPFALFIAYELFLRLQSGQRTRRKRTSV